MTFVVCSPPQSGTIDCCFFFFFATSTWGSYSCVMIVQGTNGEADPLNCLKPELTGVVYRKFKPQEKKEKNCDWVPELHWLCHIVVQNCLHALRLQICHEVVNNCFGLTNLWCYSPGVILSGGATWLGKKGVVSLKCPCRDFLHPFSLASAQQFSATGGPNLTRENTTRLLNFVTYLDIRYKAKLFRTDKRDNLKLRPIITTHSRFFHDDASSSLVQARKTMSASLNGFLFWTSSYIFALHADLMHVEQCLQGVVPTSVNSDANSLAKFVDDLSCIMEINVPELSSF